MADDELVTLRDVLNLRLTGSRLAVLSACETGLSGVELPDEVISLPAGLLQAGIAGVAASMWSVNDASTMMLMTHFYELWCGQNRAPVEALRQAQIWMRDTTNAEKADYFKGFLPELAVGKVLADTADVLYKTVALADPKVRSFAHPYHWVGFAYFGV